MPPKGTDAQTESKTSLAGDGGKTNMAAGGGMPAKPSIAGVGSVTADSTADGPQGPDDPPAREYKLGLKRRYEREGRWQGMIEPLRDQMMRESRAKGMSKAQAQTWVYSELDRLYPPLPPPEPDDAPEPPPPDDGQLQGLGSIPPDWPPLPATATLQADLQWVQSNRLYIVVSDPGGSTTVHLAHAHEPAPSRAALGWLETSIRAYAKYVDVVARSMRDEEDEQEHVRRERMRIEDIRGLLREMRGQSSGTPRI